MALAGIRHSFDKMPKTSVFEFRTELLNFKLGNSFLRVRWSNSLKELGWFHGTNETGFDFIICVKGVSSQSSTTTVL